MQQIERVEKPAHRQTIEPLAPEDRPRLISYLESDAVVPGGPYLLDPKRLTLFLYETGMHPDVLAHPARKKLQVAKNGNIRWVRAKKDPGDAGAFIDLRPHRRIEGWYKEFIEGLPETECHQTLVAVKVKVRGVWTARIENDPKSPEFGKPQTRAHCNCSKPFGDLVRMVAPLVGIPGLTARTCRHTFASRWYELTRDINIVMEKTGCSLEIALRYARLVGQKKWDAAGADMSDSPGDAILPAGSAVGRTVA